jgi:hypothetical protein
MDIKKFNVHREESFVDGQRKEDSFLCVLVAKLGTRYVEK